MNSYMVCIDNSNYKCIHADSYEVDTQRKIVRFYIEDEKIQHNVALFTLDNIRGFWKENRIEKMGE